MPTLHELLAQKAALENQQAELERRIAETKREERADAIAKVQSLMAEYGLTLADLGARLPAAKPAKPAKGGGTKAAVKFRDATTGQTWSGRGLQPNWLKAALATGRTLDEFRV
jgi:DNA-binding protein H-NS